MFGPKIKFDREFYKDLTECAGRAGYSSVEEFVRHVLEKEVARIRSSDSDQDAAKKRLQGLGYLS